MCPRLHTCTYRHTIGNSAEVVAEFDLALAVLPEAADVDAISTLW